MAVQKVFWQDPYLTTLETIVTGARDSTVTLDRTIFYAFSGGQESDSGTIGGRPVRQAQRRGLEIYYTLDGGEDLRPGDQVRIAIDWPRRYALMRLHFAAEIILELVNRHLNRPLKIGAHVGADKARLDFAWEGSIAPHFPLLEVEARHLVAADLAITSAFSNPAQERRFWSIPGFAQVACGGTHLRQTGEIGGLRLKRNNIGKGKERIEIFVED